jgi:SAM-dependent methyltransferase
MLTEVLTSMRKDPSAIASVAEVGCSLGYQLRFLETNLFPGAEVIEGMDIDDYAIRSGQEHLSAIGSRVRLHCGDMQDLDSIWGKREFDIILCAGVLMYLQEAEATEVVRNMLARTRVLLCITGLAHPSTDNSLLPTSEVRSSDKSHIHNIDRMIAAAGGTVIARRWDGDRLVEGQSIYFLFATPRS